MDPLDGSEGSSVSDRARLAGVEELRKQSRHTFRLLSLHDDIGGMQRAQRGPSLSASYWDETVLGPWLPYVSSSKIMDRRRFWAAKGRVRQLPLFSCKGLDSGVMASSTQRRWSEADIAEERKAKRPK